MLKSASRVLGRSRHSGILFVVTVAAFALGSTTDRNSPPLLTPAMKSDRSLTQWKEHTHLPLPRGGCTVGVIDGKIFVAGGTYWSDGQKVWSDRADLFDPATGRWTPVAPSPMPRADCAYVTCNHSVYAFGGGMKGSTETDAWRFANGSWSRLDGMSLPGRRRSMQGTVHEGTIYLVGGYSTDQPVSSTATVWAAQPGKAWKICAPIPGAIRISPAVASVPGGVVVAGGATVTANGVTNLDEILFYDPAADTWTLIGRLPAPLRAGFGLSHGAGLLVFGGFTDRFLDQILEINPRTGQCAVVGKLPHVLADSRFVKIGPRLFGVSGECGDKIRAPWMFETTIEE